MAENETTDLYNPARWQDSFGRTLDRFIASFADKCLSKCGSGDCELDIDFGAFETRVTKEEVSEMEDEEKHEDRCVDMVEKLFKHYYGDGFLVEMSSSVKITGTKIAPLVNSQKDTYEAGFSVYATKTGEKSMAAVDIYLYLDNCPSDKN